MPCSLCPEHRSREARRFRKDCTATRSDVEERPFRAASALENDPGFSPRGDTIESRE